MNDFADNEEAAILENFAGCISEIDCALDPVTETKLLGQPDGDVADRNDSAAPADHVDDVASIMRLDLFLNRGHYLRGAEIDLVARGRPAGNKVGAHPRNVAGESLTCNSLVR